MNRSLLSFITILGLLIFVCAVTEAQISSVIVRVNVPVVSQGQPLPVSVEFTPSGRVERVLFKYRSFGETEYREQEMLLAANSATLTLSAQYILPPYVEYYVLVELGGGKTETYPLQNAETSPLKATIRPVDPKNLEVRLLSPEQGETVAAEDLVVAVSLFYASDDVNRRGTKLYLNGVDVTAQAIFSDDVLLYSPANFPRQLNLGVQFLRVELYDTGGALYHTVESNFNLSTATAIAAQESRFRMGVDGSLEARNEDVGATKNTFLRGQLRANGMFSALTFGSNIFMTNEEKSDRQPQNRFLAYGDLDFFKIQVGDAFPKFPSYIVSGKRVRGVTANLFLKFFNVDVSFGEAVRSIDGALLRDSTITYADASAAAARPLNTVPKSGLTYSFFTPGTYSRSFLAVRPSFGSGENFQLGFTYLKSKDDVGSIRHGILPQENMVLGSDILIAFDNQRFRLEGQASLSLTNKDITKGSFTDADYDLIAGVNDPTLTPQDKTDRQDDADQIKNLAKIGGKFITINENLFPLNPIGTGLPGLAYEGSLTLNYFNNFIRAQYYQRGNAYLSFGNEFLQSDIKAFALSDRIRMFQNRALLSLSYEKREDNTGQTKVATTEYGNINSSLTVFPGVNLPSFTVGYGIVTRKSDASTKDSLTRLFVADDKTNRISLQLNYDFTAGARHSLSLGASLSDKKDNTDFKRDQKNNSFSGSLMTVYKIPLQTTLSFNTNLTESSQFGTAPLAALVTTEFKITAVSFNARYSLLNDKLQLASTVSTSLGDLNRTLAQVGVDYSFTQNLALLAQYDFIQNSGFKDDSIASLILRYNF
ncbi:MAG: hypothetical protein AABZ02_00255 [Bacteroidota bacterium]